MQAGLVAEIAVNSCIVALGFDSDRAANEIIRNNGATSRFLDFDLFLVRLEIAASNHYGAAFDGDRLFALVISIPFAKLAVAETDGSATVNSRDLFGRSPERAIGEPYGTEIVFADDDFRWIVAVHGDKLAVRNENAKNRALFNQHGRMATVRADS